MLLEDCPAARAPVRCEEPHYPVFDEFRGASYAQRYQILCERLVERQLYTAAAFELTPNNSKQHQALTPRSEEHTSELQSLMRISYAVFCLKKKKQTNKKTNSQTPS